MVCFLAQRVAEGEPMAASRYLSALMMLARRPPAAFQQLLFETCLAKIVRPFLGKQHVGSGKFHPSAPKGFHFLPSKPLQMGTAGYVL